MSIAGAKIRKATLADLNTIAGIAGMDAHGSWTRPLLEHELTITWSHVEVVELTDDPAASAFSPIAAFMVWWHVAGEVELLEIAVDKALRRRGIARLLMEHLITQTKVLGATRILLEVRRDNGPARGLYDDMGFVVVGARPRYYADGEDAVLMDRRETSGASA